MSNVHEIQIALPAGAVGRAKRIVGYDEFIKGTSGKLKRAAKPLYGKRIMHVNATAVGGGVAELLQSEIPIENALGIGSRWFVIDAPPEFFAVTKKIHDFLQGRSGRLTPAERNVYLRTSSEIGNALKVVSARFKPDIVILHDPQPLAAIKSLKNIAPTVVRLHGDFLTPNRGELAFFKPYVESASRVVVSCRAYAKNFSWLPPRRLKVISPAIDPLTNKNRSMDNAVARGILQEFGVNPTKPLMAQVSRFDPWKDPMGVIKAYYLAKNSIPDLQLILLGLMLAKDDPEALAVFEKVKKHAKGDPDIFLFADPAKLGGISSELLVNAVYTASDVMMQKSLREGFGLTMTEAMWKRRALVAGKTTGASIQIKNGRTGYIVSSREAAGRAAVRLLRNPALRKKIGRAARESVRRGFLIPRFIEDNLELYKSILK